MPIGPNDSLDAVRTWVAEAKRVVILTGAGISTESGIPDFRGPQGLWTKNPEAERLSNIRYYMAEAEIRKRAWQARLVHPAWEARPNKGHQAIADFECCGRLHALITQNVDGLHQKAGNSPERVIEVHGTVHKVMCMSCGWRGPMQATLVRLLTGEDDPACKLCGGILKSDTISFGQNLIPEVIERAMNAAAEADCFIAVGTSLQVYPIAGAVPTAKSAGARIVIVNAEPTPFDDIADALLRDPIGKTLPRILQAV